MKKILISLSIIGVVAVVAIGATIAYFNDTETSTGNILVAGTMDLKVDHGKAYYDGMVCGNGTWQCEPWGDYVVDFHQGLRKNGTPVLPERSDPTATLGVAQSTGVPSDPTLPPYSFASLGWKTGFGGDITIGFTNKIVNGSGNDLMVYEVTGGTYPEEKVKVEVSKDGITWSDAVPSVITRDGSVDLGSLDWAKYVRLTDMSDKSLFEATADAYDVDAVKALHCEANPNLVGQTCNGSWNLVNITGQQFYNFADVKPGDQGKNVISFHVYDNNGWACLSLENKQDNENVCIDPELPADTSCTAAPTDGELSQYMDAFAWRDDGDAIYEPLQGETPIPNSFFQGGAIPVADSSTGGPLVASNTKWIGLMWCAGTISVNGWGGLTCDGSTMGDITQTDSLVADVEAFAEQFRNNPNFLCNPL